MYVIFTHFILSIGYGLLSQRYTSKMSKDLPKSQLWNTNRRITAFLNPLKNAFEATMFNPRATCGPVQGFVQPSLGVGCSKSILQAENLSLFW